MNPDASLTFWQVGVTLAFAFAFLAGLAGSLAAWAWTIQNLGWLTRWTGWDRDRPKVLIGLIDLVGCAACMVVAQAGVLSLVHITLGSEALFPRGVQSVPVSEVTAALPESSSQNLESDDALKEPPVPEGTLASESSLPSEHEVGEAVAKAKDIPTWLTPILTIALLLGGLLAAALVLLRTGASLGQIGLSTHRFVMDCWIGLIVFLLVTPVILILSNIAISITEVQYSHPVLDAMAENPWAFPILFLGAVVCAPFWEEFVFRGLLIGWFDSIRSSGGRLRAIYLGGKASATEADVESEPSGDELPPWWPALASGVCFGLAHMGYGVSWIPLIAFGIVLGRLYQLRRSVVPCFVVHALFNGLSLLGLAQQVFVGKG
jgi:membrane protease YdiL (CAAX protease family)